MLLDYRHHVLDVYLPDQLPLNRFIGLRQSLDADIASERGLAAVEGGLLIALIDPPGVAQGLVVGGIEAGFHPKL